MAGTKFEYMIHFSRRPLELSAYVFKQPPTEEQQTLLGLNRMAEVAQTLQAWSSET